MAPFKNLKLGGSSLAIFESDPPPKESEKLAVGPKGDGSEGSLIRMTAYLVRQGILFHRHAGYLSVCVHTVHDTKGVCICTHRQAII